jgi:hypothetical protein
MFKVVWDKEAVENGIRSSEGDLFFLDFWVPIQVYADDVEISGLNEIPGGDISNVSSFFPNLLYVFQSMDPENLKDKNFCFGGNIKNKVYGGGFDFYVNHDKNTDMVTIKYTNRAVKEFRVLQIPLRDYAEGVLYSTAKLIEEIMQVAPDKKDDNSFHCLKNSYEIIQKWYRERYGVK